MFEAGYDDIGMRAYFWEGEKVDARDIEAIEMDYYKYDTFTTEHSHILYIKHNVFGNVFINESNCKNVKYVWLKEHDSGDGFIKDKQHGYYRLRNGDVRYFFVDKSLNRYKAVEKGCNFDFTIHPLKSGKINFYKEHEFDLVEYLGTEYNPDTDSGNKESENTDVITGPGLYRNKNGDVTEIHLSGGEYVSKDFIGWFNKRTGEYSYNKGVGAGLTLVERVYKKGETPDADDVIVGPGLYECVNGNTMVIDCVDSVYKGRGFLGHYDKKTGKYIPHNPSYDLTEYHNVKRFIGPVDK